MIDNLVARTKPSFDVAALPASSTYLLVNLSEEHFSNFFRIFCFR